MANTPGVVDFSIPLATFLATVVSDGNYADIIDDLKTDDVGNEADATRLKQEAHAPLLYRRHLVTAKPDMPPPTIPMATGSQK